MRGVLTPAERGAAWQVIEGFGIEMAAPSDLWVRAWELADKFKAPTTNDMIYLALADLRGCEFWTLDRKLARSAARSRIAIHTI